MNPNTMISFFLACSSINAATTRNSKTPTSTAHTTTAPPIFSSCLECKDGFRVSNCSDIAQRDYDNVTDQFWRQTMNATISCFLYTEGTNGEHITSTCICEEVTNTTGISQESPGERKKRGVLDTLITVLVYIAFPGFVILMFVLCRKRHHDGMSSTIHHFQNELDSDDARKQRECVLEIMFPSSTKVGVSCFIHRESPQPRRSHSATDLGWIFLADNVAGT